MIVDDHQIVGEGTKNMIELEEDIQATYILNEQEAISQSSKTPFDIYLLDMNMPNYSGLDVAQNFFTYNQMQKSFSTQASNIYHNLIY